MNRQQQKQREQCFGPRPKKKKKAPVVVGVDPFSLLPDAALVRIGKSVAELCGIRDLASLSQTSKRLQTLLIDSQETITDILRMRTSQTNISRSTISSAPIVFRTPEQLALYESCCGCYSGRLEEGEPQPSNLLEKNLLSSSPSEEGFDDLVDAVQTILETNPSASVVLDLHWGSDFNLETLDPTPLGMRILRAIFNIPDSCRYDPMDPFEQRVYMRDWSRRVTEIASKSKVPYAEKAKSGRPWVEIFLRIENRDPYEPDMIHLEVPPRPDFYNNLAVPQKVLWVINDDVDNFDDDDDVW